MISPPGSRHWLPGACSTSLISAAGLPACDLRTQANPRARYGYGIAQLLWGPNIIYFHGGETAGYNSILGYDPRNQLTLVMWSNLTVSLDPHFEGLDQVYVVSPLSPSP